MTIGMDRITELAAVIDRHVTGSGICTTAMPQVSLIRADQPSTPTPAVYEASLCLIAQGSKRVSIGDQSLVYDAAHYLLVSVDLPLVGHVIDAFHDGWRCGLEVEAGRGWMGNAVYRDLIQALVMVDLDALVLAVANTYKYKNKSTGKTTVSRDYENTVAVAEALYGHSRIRMPYQLLVIGY